ncbi:MAG: DUF6776 family protein [Gallionella sp.]
MALPFVLGAIALAWWAYDSGLEFAGFHRTQTAEELSGLYAEVAKQRMEITQLTSQVVQSERKIQIEQASNQATLGQLKSLADENVRLQEDLVFFQNLTATHGKDGELGVHRLILERDKMPGEYHLRMLLVQSGQRAKTFNGHYQLIATVVEGSETSTHVFPQANKPSAQFKLSFRYYRRVEQSIQLPAEAELESVQVRIFERRATEPKVKQTVSLL